MPKENPNIIRGAWYLKKIIQRIKLKRKDIFKKILKKKLTTEKSELFANNFIKRVDIFKFLFLE